MDQVTDPVKHSVFNMLKEEVDQFGKQRKIWLVKTGDQNIQYLKGSK